MKRSATGTILCIFLALILCSPAWAEHHAILIGVKDYPRASRLFGPVNDVYALKEILTDSFGFPERNIAVFCNRTATKQNILTAISGLTKKTGPGDFIFIYFSGHGTSTYDKYARLPMGDATGAILPYDYRRYRENYQKTLDTLIIGRRDLLPVLSRLDRDRNLFVVFDACYSGNAVRAVGRQEGVSKFENIGFPDDQPLDFRPEDFKKKVPYPYENVLYISAANEDEWARDLRNGRLTLDGKAHGALTDALLRGLAGSADTNHDRRITYRELYEFAKQGVQGFGHTPQVLYRAGLDRPVFDRPVGIDNEQVPAPSRPMRIKVTGSGKEALIREISSVNGAVVSDQDYDLLVEGKRASPGNEPDYAFYVPGGDRLCRVKGVQEALERVRRRAKVQKVLGLKNPRQNFNVRLRAGHREGKTAFFTGEKLSFHMNSEADAALLLLDIGPSGNINVILPESQNTDKRIFEGEELSLTGFGQVVPPLGVEFLKLFAFKRGGKKFRKFADNPLIRTDEHRFDEFCRTLEQETADSDNWAETLIRVVTLKSPH